ncbi:MAG: molecular chaperone DnaJ [Candidatus Berkelbacteria bacterium Licking1014_96]|uniref:Chaperone protein DnaJ n=1 Tax=Candidatus Berkelbacteria bacterium Licking1014_96 TaxID=2017149 RepID=A0A554LHG4_9BACT|nr:MAG: molecular chaperone DnaJ [Candidatus Berkelbacteria bacterium Licking1014_96]
MAEDYYKILGLEKTATEADIKRAYRKLAHQYHPDKGGGDEKKFKEVSEAYQVLSDPEKRKQYDQFGHTFDYETTGAGQGFGGFDFSGFGGQQDVEFDFSNLGDIFETFFGGENRARETRGRDLEYRVEITFEQAVKGASIPIELEKNIYCDCPKITCLDCQGVGKKETLKSTILGQFKSIQTCPKCQGAGKIAKADCPNCQGKGTKKERVKIEVVIPAGIREGMTVRVQGQGETSASGHSGDLYLEVHLKPHSQFYRREDDLYYDLNLTFAQAALGDKINVPIVNGIKKIKIPAGIQSSEEIRLKGLGFSHLNHFGSGDEVIKIKVITPKNLNSDQKRLLEELKKLDS